MGKYEREIPRGKPRRIYECNIKIKLQVNGYGLELILSKLG
jgi:hypothetical protein